MLESTVSGRDPPRPPQRSHTHPTVGQKTRSDDGLHAFLPCAKRLCVCVAGQERKRIRRRKTVRRSQSLCVCDCFFDSVFVSECPYRSVSVGISASLCFVSPGVSDGFRACRLVCLFLLLRHSVCRCFCVSLSPHLLASVLASRCACRWRFCLNLYLC